MFAPSAPTLASAHLLAPRPLRHRGFTLEVRAGAGRPGAAGWGYAVHHEGLLLHAERAGHRTAAAAERAARRLVDDALASYDRATRTDASLRLA